MCIRKLANLYSVPIGLLVKAYRRSLARSWVLILAQDARWNVDETSFVIRLQLKQPMKYNKKILMIGWVSVERCQESCS